MEDKKLYSTREAAAALGVSDGALRLMIMRGKFTPKNKIGKVWAFTAEEIEEIRNLPKSKGGRPRKQ